MWPLPNHFEWLHGDCLHSSAEFDDHCRMKVVVCVTLEVSHHNAMEGGEILPFLFHLEAKSVMAISQGDLHGPSLVTL